MDTIERIFALADEKFPEQQEFASALGVTPSIVSQWRNRVPKSYERRLSQIAAVLGTTVEYLVTGETKKGPAAEDGHEPSENELLFRSLSPEKQKEALRYMRYLASQEAAPGEGPDR